MGSTRYDVEGLPENVFGLAFKAPTKQSTELGSASASLILMNMGSTTQQIDFSKTGLGTGIGGIFTNREYDWQEGSLTTSVQLPALSVITVLFS